MSQRPIRKVLVANRGEIAVRVIRTCRERGIETAAVYSEPDRTALHVRMADEAYLVGPAPSAESYLVQERILEVAERSGADAIHPGYGFLSENAAFAEACAEAGVVFIGPPPKAIREMGDKTAARTLMERANVPMAPGTVDAIGSVGEAVRVADEIGYPVLIKAAAGGGGKGMRAVHDAAEIEKAVRGAQGEAKSAFGDERVFVEKLFINPRHIEFQVLADGHGTVVHLFERECSIQRRHQKVIEEAPSAVLTPELRAAMGEAAVQAARACGYVGAGTVEFLVDADLDFYFLEMNTRLQVEHPVTEWITGLDLVWEQVRVAQGEPLGYGQDDLAIHGHAVESRVYAEDPVSGFLPDPGPLLRHAPPSGFGVRVDAGVEQGDEIPIHYDPMISKLTAWGRTREEAIRRMDRALSEYDVAGVQTTIPFCRFVMGHEAFRSGHFNTGFVAEHFAPEVLQREDAALERAAAVAAALFAQETKPRAVTPNGTDGVPREASRWARRRAY
ncbi:MAG: acetyl-CoA carboxylase biotin carboxylase subunit [Rhodothermales bacterium]|nr:acetyl-CoA carboxylase biotin carboxylase subunit [Rhodothermales bacterium]